MMLRASSVAPQSGPLRGSRMPAPTGRRRVYASPSPSYARRIRGVSGPSSWVSISRTLTRDWAQASSRLFAAPCRSRASVPRKLLLPRGQPGFGAGSPDRGIERAHAGKLEIGAVGYPLRPPRRERARVRPSGPGGPSLPRGNRKEFRTRLRRLRTWDTVLRARPSSVPDDPSFCPRRVSAVGFLARRGHGEGVGLAPPRRKAALYAVGE